MTASTPAALPVRVDPTYWVACLDDIAQPETLQRWVEQPRFRPRLIERLQQRHRLVAPDELPSRDPVDNKLCVLDADALALAIRAAGVIVHADAITREIHAPRVAAIRQRLGSDLYALALARRDAARRPAGRDAAIGDDLDAFEIRVEQAGERCLRAWAQTQPDALRAWLQLGWAGRLCADEPRAQTTEPDQATAAAEADIDLYESDDGIDHADAAEIARLAAGYLLSRPAPSDQAERQDGEP